MIFQYFPIFLDHEFTDRLGQFFPVSSLGLNGGEEIEVQLDPKEEASGEADGTGVPINGIKRRGKELKVFVQYKKGGGIRVAGVHIGNYNGGWEKLFKKSLEGLKGFKRFLLITDGDTSILDSLKGKVSVLLQRCLWHIPHQLKYMLWKDKVTRKGQEWLYVLSEVLEICAIRPGIQARHRTSPQVGDHSASERATQPAAVTGETLRPL
jgi:hypothetical protein